MRSSETAANMKSVSTVDELVAATKDKGTHHIVVHGALTNAPSIRLAPGQSIRGDGDAAAITFAADIDGLQLGHDLVRREELAVIL